MAVIYELDKKRSLLGSMVPLMESEVPVGFPMSVWNNQSALYTARWSKFLGQNLDMDRPGEYDEVTKEPVKIWPLQINHVKRVSMIHAFTVFGDVPDNDAPLFLPRPTARPESPQKEEIETPKEESIEDTRAWEAFEFLKWVFSENSGRAIQQEAALVQQFLGGCVFRVSYEPDNEDLEFHIRIEHIVPDFFLPIYDNSYNLIEAYLVWRMPAAEAIEKYGVELALDGRTSVDPVYCEHWKKDSITISINAKPITMKVGGVSITYDKAPNPFKAIPVFYIPSIRYGGYYGASVADDIDGLTKEINSRLADMGTIIQDSAKQLIWVRDLNAGIKMVEINKGQKAINLGPSRPDSKFPPEMGVIEPGTLPAELAGYPEILRQEINRAVFIPPVAEGEDEGSQRSALTLSMRLMPLTSRARATRNLWHTEMVKMCKFILKMAALKKIWNIKKEHLSGFIWNPEWNPMIPRDRESSLNEAVLGVQTGIVSPMTARENLNMVVNSVEEEERVRAWATFQSDLAAQQKMKAQIDVDTPTASTGMSEQNA